jgi:enoyl-CoA hydratase
MTHAIRPVDFDNLKTMTYEVTDRVARITFNRPDKGNAIIADTPLELSALVERADLDPNVHVILVSGRGEGFCAGFDLSAYADRTGSAGGTGAYDGTSLDGKTQAAFPACCTRTSRQWSRSMAIAWPAAPISRCTPTR